MSVTGMSDRVATAVRLVAAAGADLRGGVWRPTLAEGQGAARLLAEVPQLDAVAWPSSGADRIALVGRLGAGVRGQILAGAPEVPNRGSFLKMFEVVLVDLARAADRGLVPAAQAAGTLDQLQQLTADVARLLREVAAAAPAPLRLDSELAGLMEAAQAAAGAATRDAQAGRWRPPHAEERAADAVLTARSGPTLGQVVFDGAEPASAAQTLANWARMAAVIRAHQAAGDPALDAPYGYLGALAELLEATARRAAGMDEQQQDQLVAAVGETVGGVEVLLAAIATGDLEP